MLKCRVLWPKTLNPTTRYECILQFKLQSAKLQIQKLVETKDGAALFPVESKMGVLGHLTALHPFWDPTGMKSRPTGMNAGMLSNKPAEQSYKNPGIAKLPHWSGDSMSTSMRISCGIPFLLLVCSKSCFAATASAPAAAPSVLSSVDSGSVACPTITSERLDVLQNFLEAPSLGLNASEFVAAVYEAFTPDATLSIPETGSYEGVEDIAEYVLVTNSGFNGGYFTAESYTINPDQVALGNNWIQVR